MMLSFCLWVMIKRLFRSIAIPNRPNESEDIRLQTTRQSWCSVRRGMEGDPNILAIQLSAGRHQAIIVWWYNNTQSDWYLRCFSQRQERERGEETSMNHDRQAIPLSPLDQNRVHSQAPQSIQLTSGASLAHLIWNHDLTPSHPILSVLSSFFLEFKLEKRVQMETRWTKSGPTFDYSSDYIVLCVSHHQMPFCPSYYSPCSHIVLSGSDRQRIHVIALTMIMMIAWCEEHLIPLSEWMLRRCKRWTFDSWVPQKETWRS